MSELFFQVKEGMYQVITKDNLSEPKKMYELDIHNDYFVDNEIDMLKHVKSDLETLNDMVENKINEKELKKVRKK